MKKGDTVKFKEANEKGEENLLMVVEEMRGDRCLVRSLINMKIQPTHVYMVNDLVVVQE